MHGATMRPNVVIFVCDTGSAGGNTNSTPSRALEALFLIKLYIFKAAISAFGVQRRRAAVQRFGGKHSRHLQGHGARLTTRPGLAKAVKHGEVTIQ